MASMFISKALELTHAEGCHFKLQTLEAAGSVAAPCSANIDDTCFEHSTKKHAFNNTKNRQKSILHALDRHSRFLLQSSQLSDNNPNRKSKNPSLQKQEITTSHTGTLRAPLPKPGRTPLPSSATRLADRAPRAKLAIARAKFNIVLKENDKTPAPLPKICQNKLLVDIGRKPSETQINEKCDKVRTWVSKSQECISKTQDFRSQICRWMRKKSSDPESKQPVINAIPPSCSVWLSKPITVTNPGQAPKPAVQRTNGHWVPSYLPKRPSPLAQQQRAANVDKTVSFELFDRTVETRPKKQKIVLKVHKNGSAIGAKTLMPPKETSSFKRKFTDEDESASPPPKKNKVLSASDLTLKLTPPLEDDQNILKRLFGGDDDEKQQPPRKTIKLCVIPNRVKNNNNNNSISPASQKIIKLAANTNRFNTILRPRRIPFRININNGLRSRLSPEQLEEYPWTLV